MAFPSLILLLSAFAPVVGQPLCLRYVALLRALVAAAKQDKQPLSFPHDIDPIAGAVGNPHFADTFAHWFDIAQIAGLRPLDAARDAGRSLLVPQRRKPVPECLRLLDNVHGKCTLRSAFLQSA
jgi:hypothetical protein